MSTWTPLPTVGALPPVVANLLPLPEVAPVPQAAATAVSVVNAAPNLAFASSQESSALLGSSNKDINDSDWGGMMYDYSSDEATVKVEMPEEETQPINDQVNHVNAGPMQFVGRDYTVHNKNEPDIEMDKDSIDGEDGLFEPGADEQEEYTRQQADVFQFVDMELREEGAVYVCLACRSAELLQEWHCRSVSNFCRHLEKKHKAMYNAARYTVWSPRAPNGPMTPPPPADRDDAEKLKDQLQRATDALCRWIVTSAHSFSLSQQQGFVEVCNILNPSFVLPSRKVVRSLIEQQWMQRKLMVREELEDLMNGRCFGLTWDSWTSNSNRGYMVLTVHFTDDDWKLRSVIVSFKYVTTPHDAARLSQAFLEGISEMSPRLLKHIWAVTCDNASTNIAMVNLLNEGALQSAIDANHEDDRHDDAAIPVAQGATPAALSWVPQVPAASAVSSAARASGSARAAPVPPVLPPGFVNKPGEWITIVRCFAHTLQLAIKAAIGAVPLMESALGHFRDWAKQLRVSTKLMECLHTVCVTTRTKAILPPKDVATRWNSTYEMCKGILCLKPALIELAYHIRCSHTGFVKVGIKPYHPLVAEVPAENWVLLSEFCAFLKAFQRATVIMSGSTYPTAGLILPMFELITEHVALYHAKAASVGNDYMVRFATIVKAKLEDYRPHLTEPRILMAAALDPRIKNSLGILNLDEDEVVAMIKLEWETHYVHLHPHLADPVALPQECNNRGSALQALFALDGDAQPRPQGTFVAEISRWLYHPALPLKTCDDGLLEYMKANAPVFPRVAIMAKDFLALPATSVPSEQAFLRAGCIVNKYRSRLSNNSVTMLCELQSFFNFQL
jgi:hAT family C-terminal dimerisation region